MAPAAKSRKGKKAWRKNIDASEVETFLEEETYQQRRGPAAKELKDDQLFFVDTAADDEGAAAVAEGKRPAKRRREEAAARPLRAELIIADAHKVKPLTLAPPPRKPTAMATAGGTAKAGALAVAPAAKRVTNGRRGQPHPLDLWADEGLTAVEAAPGPGSAALVRQEQERMQGAGKKVKKAASGAAGSGGGGGAKSLRHMGPSAKALRKSSGPALPRMRAVAVDVPGCSFNPDEEQHQDALALLVAAEMKKELRKELLPTAPPLEVDAPEGRPYTELEMLQVEAADSDSELEEQQQAANGANEVADPNSIALLADGEDDLDDGGEEDGEGPGSARKRKMVKKTKQDRNKEARRKAAEAELGARRRAKAQRRELHSLKDLQAQLEEEQQEKENRRLRKLAVREERAAVEPPRLGKLRFEPQSVQVLTSDEKSGSLRQVVPCAMLAADRFKSLQQRGLLEPRKPQPFKEKRRKVTYEKGARSERQEVASTEVRELTRKNKKARRQAKTAERAARGLDGDEWM